MISLKERYWNHVEANYPACVWYRKFNNIYICGCGVPLNKKDVVLLRLTYKFEKPILSPFSETHHWLDLK